MGSTKRFSRTTCTFAPPAATKWSPAPSPRRCRTTPWRALEEPRASERTARHPLHLVDRLGFHLAGPSGNHVDAGGGRTPRTVSGEHGRPRAERSRFAAPAAAGPQLVA